MEDIIEWKREDGVDKLENIIQNWITDFGKEVLNVNRDDMTVVAKIYSEMTHLLISGYSMSECVMDYDSFRLEHDKLSCSFRWRATRNFHCHLTGEIDRGDFFKGKSTFVVMPTIPLNEDGFEYIEGFVDYFNVNNINDKADISFQAGIQQLVFTSNGQNNVDNLHRFIIRMHRKMLYRLQRVMEEGKESLDWGVFY